MPITIPEKVTVKAQGAEVTVQGPKGELRLPLPPHVAVQQANGTLTVACDSSEQTVRSSHGTIRTLLANMMAGVTTGFSKELELVGVGFRAQVSGSRLTLVVGFSHDAHLTIPQGITIETPKPTMVIVKGIDKQLVGQVAADIRRVFPPEPYKGKGIKYADEVVRKKAGKAAVAAAGAGGGAGGGK